MNVLKKYKYCHISKDEINEKYKIKIRLKRCP